MVCNHPTEEKSYRKMEIHVQFFDDPVSRSWVSIDLIKMWGEKIAAGGEEDPTWQKGCQEAREVEDMSNDERLGMILVPHLPSDDDWDGEDEVSPGSKENDPVGISDNQKPKKRRRIMEIGSDDDSGDDETFKPTKKDLEEVAKEEEEECEEDGDASADESCSNESDEVSPVKKSGAKRKRCDKAGPSKKAKIDGALSTPVRKFAMKNSLTASPRTPSSSAGINNLSPSIFGVKSSNTSSSLPNVNDSTKKKLSMFGASDQGRASAAADEDKPAYKHNSHDFMQPKNIKDKDGRKKDNPDYNPRTLYVPERFLHEQTPAQRQWWQLKSDHFDVILFFKMGKFYELFHMDADVGVSELNLVYMKGDVAHAGFPEVAYGRYAATLVERGYKVARIEQTETPADMENRIRNMTGKATKFDKVVAREICQLTTRGTRVNNFLDSDNFEGDPKYLLAIYETSTEERTFGVAFVDTTIGIFHLGQFVDDKNLSRLRTLTSHYPPTEILLERGGLSTSTLRFLNCSLPGVRKEVLRKATEFWETEKTLGLLAEKDYFEVKGEEFSWPDEFQELVDAPEQRVVRAKPEAEFAVKALGALIWYLSVGFLDQELLSLRKFQVYRPVDSLNSTEETAVAEQTACGPTGKYMVLDGMTIRNLDLVPGPSGESEGTLLARIDSCLTPMGKRTLRHWVVTPLCQAAAIRQRQIAVSDLMSLANASDIRLKLKKVPDLERLLSKIHTVGDQKRGESHPDSRAVMFEINTYSKRKILDLLMCLEGLKTVMEIMQTLQGNEFESKMLKNITLFEGQGGEFPDLTNILDYFDNAFDHTSARKEGKIMLSEGVDQELDAANEQLAELAKEMNDYLREQKQHFGCDVKYWGTGKNRFQLEIPVERIGRAGSEYTLASGTKKLKRFTTETTLEFLERQLAAENCRELALLDIQRKMFFTLSKHATVLRKAIGCVALLDCLLSLASYSASLQTSCVPEVVSRPGLDEPCINITEGSHPCLDLKGDTLIPNDTVLGKDRNLIIITGPNMGGKSTLMRQTGLLVILAQIGAMVPATEMKFSPVDRIFTRLGAQDNIIGGESTFLVELQETGTILQHATRHSLVLIDELGRGTATYDGTAIAGAVLSFLAARACRTLFATHYHNLTQESINGVFCAHMACMVENEGHEDITQETITFLYKLVDGPCPKSHGFNAAKLAGLPDSIIRRGYAKAREFELNEANNRRRD